jgi:ABC-2 type transport system permease protein
VHHGASLATQVRLVAWRSIRGTLRRPASLAPPLIMPLMLLTINSAGLADAPKIPGFPAKSYLDFALVVTFMQGALFSTMISGIALGRDIESGFLDRLALTPIRGAALVMGQLAGSLAIAFGASLIYLAVGFGFGAEFKSGFGGVIVLLLLACCTALSFATVGSFLALRAGSSEAVQGLFPVLFASLFLSTMTMPLNLIEADWFHAIARWNPISYVVDGMRSLVITGWDGTALIRDVGILAAALMIGITGCSFALRGRLTRT